jgi:hypothetical protein
VTPVVSTYQVDTTAVVRPRRMSSVFASCDPGDILSGGGYAVSDEFQGHRYRVNTSSPRSAAATDWVVRMENLDDSPLEFHVRAVCLHVENPVG